MFKRYGIGIAKGLSVTIRHLLRIPITTQYPEQRLNPSRRTRGNELIWDEKRCTGCGTCAKTCPQGSIDIITSTKIEENKYKVEKFEVDMGYCIFCGLCVEACPYDALFLGYSYERAKYRRGELVMAKEALLETEGRPRSGYFHPDIAEKLPKQSLLVDRNKGERR
jgi:NADH-quinone oxidoreductase chain I